MASWWFNWYSHLVAQKRLLIERIDQTTPISSQSKQSQVKHRQAKPSQPKPSQLSTYPRLTPNLRHIPTQRGKTASSFLICLLSHTPSIQTENWFEYTKRTQNGPRIFFSKIDDVIEEVMKMEVLPVQSQFQGQFSVMGSSKIKGR